MKICRFITDQKDASGFGILTDDWITPIGVDNIFNQFDQAELTAKIYETKEKIRSSMVKWLPPSNPSKIVCIGRNYAEHAKELGNQVPAEPLLFLKANTSLITEGEAILLPPQSSQVEHEGELAVVIKRTAKNIGEEENPFDYVLGYACLNDVTARDLQRRDVQFTRAKSFDTFCPIGHFIETDLDPTNLSVTVRVNGQVKQQGNTKDMVFPVADIIRYISRQMTLLPGDVIATGTPSGVSKLEAGDVCTIEIEGIGILTNPVC
jgi:2-keto-4-pentenoate hydratase/2-oxohepta-3-ene-1,7-dioic acid hydratase in catechol pathway